MKKYLQNGNPRLNIIADLRLINRHIRPRVATSNQFSQLIIGRQFPQPPIAVEFGRVVIDISHVDDNWRRPLRREVVFKGCHELEGVSAGQLAVDGAPGEDGARGAVGAERQGQVRRLVGVVGGLGNNKGLIWVNLISKKIMNALLLT